MGYSSEIMGYILYDLVRQKFFLNRDVIFHDNQFLFKALINTDVHTVSDSFAYPNVFSNPYSSIASDPHPPIATSPLPDPLLHNPVAPASTSPNSIHTPVSLPTRKSIRTSNPPLWLAGYVTKPISNSTLYPLTNYVSYTNFVTIPLTLSRCFFQQFLSLLPIKRLLKTTDGLKPCSLKSRLFMIIILGTWCPYLQGRFPLDVVGFIRSSSSQIVMLKDLKLDL